MREHRPCSVCGQPVSPPEPDRHWRSTCSKACAGELIRRSRLKHGESPDTGKSATPEYVAWMNMRGRCEDARNKHFADYGGRGIRVCAEWRGSFETFLRDLGRRPSPSHSIDRYPDTNGNYEPGNVRWATPAQQSRNQRRNVYVEHEGERMVVTDWANRLGMLASTLSWRIRAGWPHHLALTVPASHRNGNGRRGSA